MSHSAVDANIENFPDIHEPYRALAIMFPWEVLDIARNLLSGSQMNNTPASSDVVSVGELSAINNSLLIYLSDANVTDSAIRNYRLLGILLALFRAGHGQFLRSTDPSYSSRIRMAVSAAPSREWTSSHFEEVFYLSGATLRRRLASEGTSLRELIQDARLHSALMQLQTSVIPIKAVAASHGYLSVSAFRRGFYKRFGLDPSDVANPKLST
jgi:AraC-like DNA-binding protein